MSSFDAEPKDVLETPEKVVGVLIQKYANHVSRNFPGPCFRARRLVKWKKMVSTGKRIRENVDLLTFIPKCINNGSCRKNIHRFIQTLLRDIKRYKHPPTSVWDKAQTALNNAVREVEMMCIMCDYSLAFKSWVALCDVLFPEDKVRV